MWKFYNFISEKKRGYNFLKCKKKHRNIKIEDKISNSGTTKEPRKQSNLHGNNTLLSAGIQAHPLKLEKKKFENLETQNLAGLIGAQFAWMVLVRLDGRTGQKQGLTTESNGSFLLPSSTFHRPNPLHLSFQPPLSLSLPHSSYLHPSLQLRLLPSFLPFFPPFAPIPPF